MCIRIRVWKKVYKENEDRPRIREDVHDIRTMGQEAPCGSRHKYTSKVTHS